MHTKKINQNCSLSKLVKVNNSEPKKQKHKIKNKKAKHNWNKNPTENQNTKKNKSCSFKLPKQKLNNKINNIKRFTPI